MEIVISVSEAELEEFPEEEAPESSGKQEQSGKASPKQGTVKSSLSIDTSPTSELLEKIKRGRIVYLLRCTPEGGSNQGFRIIKLPRDPSQITITSDQVACNSQVYKGAQATKVTCDP